MYDIIKEFFIEALGIDISDVIIERTSMDSILGSYSVESPGIIRVNSNISGAIEQLTIVHEIAHLLQYERAASISIPKEKFNSVDMSIWDNCAIEYKNQPVEIDARITELCYLYYAGYKKAGEEEAIKGVRSYAKNILCDPAFSPVLMVLINNIPNSFSAVRGVLFEKLNSC